MVLGDHEPGKIANELKKEPIRLYDAHQISSTGLTSPQQRQALKDKMKEMESGYP
jgi:hypothetical protein